MGALSKEIEDILNAALVCEFSAVNSRGRPVTHPMIPLYDGELIYMTSSILFSKKLAHVRSNPKVAISISDRNAVHGEPFRDRVTIQGDATLHDADVHSDWERILPIWTAKEPIVAAFYAKRVALPLFWERVLIEMRPRRALLWEKGNTEAPPKVFSAAGVA
jgi:general stress protein 26